VTKGRPIIALCAIALVGLVFSAGYWMTGTARTAMSRQVIASETIAAKERAAQIADAVNVAHERLLASANLPGAVLAIERGDVGFLRAALAGGIVNKALTRITITRGDEVLAQSPADRPAILVDDDATHLRTYGQRDARLTFSTPIRNGAGEVIARLHEELSLNRLVPRFTQSFSRDRDVATLVTTDGVVLATAASDPVARLRSPELLELVSHRESDGITYHSDELDAERISSTAPVPGHPWVVIIDADASAANAPAASLVRKLFAGFAVMSVLAVAILAVASAVMVSTRRHLQRLHQRSVRDAATDSLTGTLNRRGFEERLAGLRESDATVGVVMVDVDNLKEINDNHGHGAGDLAIRLVADSIRGAVRSADSVFRIGGDEFVVLLPDVASSEAARLADRISDAVSDQVFLNKRRLRASVGAAVGQATSVDDVLREADAEMYRVKATKADSPVL
jgi:diguanylate cyclase (GGDEF)-like protein